MIKPTVFGGQNTLKKPFVLKNDDQLIDDADIDSDNINSKLKNAES